MSKVYESPFHAFEDEHIASNMMLRADLAIMIRDIIEQNGWTQKEAALHLGIQQPHISLLMNGKISKFSLDKMFSMLDSLGFRAKFLSHADNPHIVISKQN